MSDMWLHQNHCNIGFMHTTSEPMDIRLLYLVWSQVGLPTNTLYTTAFKIKTLINKTRRYRRCKALDSIS